MRLFQPVTMTREPVAVEDPPLIPIGVDAQCVTNRYGPGCNKIFVLAKGQRDGSARCKQCTPTPHHPTVLALIKLDPAHWRAIVANAPERVGNPAKLPKDHPRYQEWYAKVIAGKERRWSGYWTDR